MKRKFRITPRIKFVDDPDYAMGIFIHDCMNAWKEWKMLPWNRIKTNIIFSLEGWMKPYHYINFRNNHVCDTPRFWIKEILYEETN